jgi:non-heme Fe2+,alpha-ketoglutarate-dependent halogenase
MTRLLTEDLRGRYLRDGLLFPVRVLAPEEAHRYRLACEELEALLGGKPRTVEVRQMHLHFAWAHELATHPRLLDAVEDLLGPDLLIWATELFAKHPHDAAVSIGWHRDRPYMGFSGETLTAWIALSDSTSANGCMRAVPGPGRRDTRTSEGAVDVVLRAGEMSLHDADIWHGSDPNLSGTKRVGFAVRFVTPRTHPRASGPPVVLARGSHRNGPFRVVDPPAAASGTGALAGMKESAARHLEAMLANLRSVASLDSPQPCGGRARYDGQSGD